jgi:hypothetical protein
MRPAFGRHTERLKDEDILASGSFVPEPLPGEETVRADLPGVFPAVAVGWPETKNLAGLLGKDDLERIDPSVRADMKKNDFFLVRLCCSFLPGQGDRVLHSVRLIFLLKSDGRRQQPRVSAMYPVRVVAAVEERSRMGLDASLQFVPIVGAPPAAEGAIATGVEYATLAPKITAAFNFDQSGVLWDFERTDADELRGVRYMYLLLRASAGSTNIRAGFILSARVRSGGRLRNAVFAPGGRASPLMEVDLLSGKERAVSPPPPA